jgi:hypothetical protein
MLCVAQGQRFIVGKFD